MMQEILRSYIDAAVQSVYDGGAVTYTVDHPPERFGDFSTNAPFVIAKETQRSPLAVAEMLAGALREAGHRELASVTVVSPGFVNLTLSDTYLAAYAKNALRKDWGRHTLLKGEKIAVEYTDPNPFKEMHIGHLMSNTIGESFARVAEAMGGDVVRVCYQGDVGVHVAKAVWALRKHGGDITKEVLGAAYAEGARRYEGDERVKEEIDALNVALYRKEDAELTALYTTGKRVSLEAFEELYRRVGTVFDRYVFESEVAPIGLRVVEEHIGDGVFEKDEGAVVFRAEKYDKHLHTRVFITRKGLPTYETKELGLAVYKEEVIHPDASYIITGNEIIAYVRVVREALKRIKPALARYMKHIPHGMLRLTTGKMSSRTGDVISAAAFIDTICDRVRQQSDLDLSDTEADRIAVAAVRYAILRQEKGKDIVFDPQRSLSLKGDSGPYLLYTVVRLHALSRKGTWSLKHLFVRENIYPYRPVIRLLYHYEEAVERAWRTGESNHLVSYLTKLAGAVNTWYAGEKILGTEQEREKLCLAAAAANTLSKGLYLLGISTVERM